MGVAITSGSEYTILATPNYTVLLAKFFASCALHLMLYPEIARSMRYMKYILNHPEFFTNWMYAFSIALTAHHVNILAEVVNLYMLLFQHSVEHCIIHFVALEIIVEIPHYYNASLINDNLKDELFKDNHALHVHNCARDIPWNSRSLCNRLGRIVYRLHRALYVAVIFYFQPFIVLILFRATAERGKFPEGGEE